MRQFEVRAEPPPWEVLYLKGESTVAKVCRSKGEPRESGRGHWRMTLGL